MTKVFAVMRCGVNIKGFGGIFSTFDKANKAAQHFVSLEPDDYHIYNIYELEMDETVNFDASGYGHLDDGKHVVSWLCKES
jgi:uncharacterized membrane protein